MIGAASAVLSNGATELGHGQNDHVVHAIPKIGHERRDTLREIAESTGELSLSTALIHVRVPTANVSECHFKSNA